MSKIIIVFLVACESVFAFSIAKPERSFSGSITNIVIELDSGNLNFKGKSDSNGIKVISRPQNNLCQDTLEIKEQTFNLVNKKSQGGCPCDYDIYTHQSTSIQIKSGTSDVTVNGMTSFLNIRNGAGNIEGDSLLKGIDIKLGTGNVKLNVNNGPTLLNIGVGKGVISYPKIPESKTDVEMTVGSGDAQLNIPATSQVFYDPRTRVRSPVFVHHSENYNFRILMVLGFGKTIISKI